MSVAQAVAFVERIKERRQVSRSVLQRISVAADALLARGHFSTPPNTDELLAVDR
jgi:hypothetical protein